MDHCIDTDIVEPVIKDHPPLAIKYGLWRQVVFGDKSQLHWNVAPKIWQDLAFLQHVQDRWSLIGSGLPR